MLSQVDLGSEEEWEGGGHWIVAAPQLPRIVHTLPLYLLGRNSFPNPRTPHADTLPEFIRSDSYSKNQLFLKNFSSLLWLLRVT